MLRLALIFSIIFILLFLVFKFIALPIWKYLTKSLVEKSNEASDFMEEEIFNDEPETTVQESIKKNKKKFSLKKKKTKTKTKNKRK